jgi:hypothetical protein
MSVAIAGCVDTREPISTVRSAGGAILENNLKDFRETLDESVREDLGTQAKLDELRAKLLEHKKTEMGRAVLTYSEQGDQGFGFTGDVLRKFDVDLSDRVTGESILKTEVKCSVKAIAVNNSNSNCSGTIPVCEPKFFYVEHQDCRIAKIF